MASESGYVTQYNEMPSLREGARQVRQLGGLKYVRNLISPLLTEEEQQLAKENDIFIRINHRHFTLNKKQVLVEHKPSGDGCLKAFPQNFNANEHKPYYWTINDNKRILAMEFSDDGGVKKFTDNNACLALVHKLLFILNKNGLHKIIGIHSNKRESLPLIRDYSYKEKTMNGFSIRELIPSDEAMMIEGVKTVGIPLVIGENSEDLCADVCEDDNGYGCERIVKCS